MKRKDLTGCRFEKLTVVSFAGFYGRHTHWNCSCDCGGSTVATSNNLIRRNTLSCGCIQRKRASDATKKHGLSNSNIYKVWRGMLNRCENKKQILYHRYGGRGISVCKRWHSFENFLSDMGFPEDSRMSIDRKNNNGNYCKSNCRWTTIKINSRNKENTIFLKWENKRIPLSALAEKYDLKYACLYKRIKRGWKIEEALLTPSGGKRKEI